ncbi:MAG: hypothetical protein V1487_02395 [bacterium]
MRHPLVISALSRETYGHLYPPIYDDNLLLFTTTNPLTGEIIPQLRKRDFDLLVVDPEDIGYSGNDIGLLNI